MPLSFVFHHCTIDGFNRVDQISFVTRCYECAVTAIKIAKEELPAKMVFKFAPDLHGKATRDDYSAVFCL